MRGTHPTDAGIAALDFIYKQMGIDDEWAIRTPRELTWWGHNLAQRVRAEEPVPDRGLSVSRLTAVTPIVRNVTADPFDACKYISLTNSMGAILSGFVFDEETREVSLACSARVFDDPDVQGFDAYRDATTRMFLVAVGAQAAQAHLVAESLAKMFEGTPATSHHPESGARVVPDDMLNLLSVFRQRGSEGSVWTGEQMQRALKSFREAGLFANGDDDGVTAEIPFYDTTALLVLRADDKHPTIGSGLSVQLALPWLSTMEVAAPTAAVLNRAEMNPHEREFSNYMGGWCVGPDEYITFGSFYPNSMPARGFATTIAQEAITRVRWLTRSMFQDPRHPSPCAKARTSFEEIFGIAH
jgi:hypothetical protein